jgi:hypothetical protein
LFGRNQAVSRAYKKLYNKKERFVKDVGGKFFAIFDEQVMRAVGFYVNKCAFNYTVSVVMILSVSPP